MQYAIINMHSKSRDPPKTSVSLSSAALAQHYSKLLKQGGVFHAVAKGPSLGGPPLPPSYPTSSTFKPAPPPSELQMSLSSSWACEGCGHFPQQLHTQSCAICGLSRTKLFSGSASNFTTPASLAHRLGLVAPPHPPPTPQEWLSIESLVSSRVFSLEDLQTPLTCPICRSLYGMRDCVITSCAHIFHAACLGNMERLVCESGGDSTTSNKGHAGVEGRCCPLCRTTGYFAHPTRLPALRHIHDCAVIAQRVVRGWMVRARLFNLHWKRLVLGGEGGVVKGELPTGLFRAFLSKALSKCALGEFGEEAIAQASETRAALDSADAALAACAASGKAAEAALPALLEKRRKRMEECGKIGGAFGVGGDASKTGITGNSSGACLEINPPPSAHYGPGLKERGGQSEKPPVLLPLQQFAILKSIAERLVVLGSKNAGLAGVRAVVSAAAVGASLRLERVARGREERTRLGPLSTVPSSPALTSCGVVDWGAVEVASEALYGGGDGEAGEGEGGECCVCLNPLVWGGNACALLPCAHRIHGACLDALEDAWTRKGAGKSCPLCRREYASRRHTSHHP